MQTVLCRSMLSKISRLTSSVLTYNNKYTSLNKSIFQSNYAHNALNNHFKFISTGVDNKTSKNTDGVLTIEEIHEFLVQHNCKDIVFIELPNHVNYLPYFIIATANSYRHLNNTSEHFNKLYKEKKKPEDPFTLIDGKKENQSWHAIDVQNAVVHIMLEKERLRYQLEKLWVLGPDHDSLVSEPQYIDDESSYSLVDFERGLIEKGDSVTFVDDQEVKNPWEVEYDEEKSAGADFNEDEYVI